MRFPRNAVAAFSRCRHPPPQNQLFLYYFKSLMQKGLRGILRYDEERKRRRSGATSSFRDKAIAQKTRKTNALMF